MRRFGVATAVLIALGMLPAGAQTDPADDDLALPAAQVGMAPLPSGDVSVSVVFEGGVRAADLPGLLRQTLGCDVRNERLYTTFIWGVCRHLIAGDGAVAHGTLRLAALTAELRKAGARSVSIEVWLTADAQPAIDTSRLDAPQAIL